MPENFEWVDDDETILLVRVDAVRTVEDGQAITDKNTQLLNTKSHPVDLIVDARKLNIASRVMMSWAQYGETQVPDNQRLVCVIGANTAVRTLVALVQRLRPRVIPMVRFCDSLDDAIGVIEEYREQNASD